MNKFLSYVAWAEIGLCALTGAILMVPVFLVTAPFDPNRRASGRMFRLIGVWAARLHPYWRFRVHGDFVRPRGNTVVVGNHASQADPFLISCLPWEMKWLTKIEMFRIPVMGALLKMAGDIPVHRGQRDSAKDAMARCGEYLQRGMPVMIFPEGTRSKDGQLQPFKDGAFRLAIENQSELLPIAVAGTHHALPKHSGSFGRARAFVTVGRPISTEGMTLDDLDALKVQAREAIAALMSKLEAETDATRKDDASAAG
ncbi:MAG: 1-acyl-sn-glycerol-3-phosphate acyltransferase [Deltaproteobacteria bacterium]|nr:MAG: 1-acyl-sn-glycerol-3-phosphate acyltransferase [Deltaproteobacteria bacterium]